jgi:hypothetical protein
MSAKIGEILSASRPPTLSICSFWIFSASSGVLAIWPAGATFLAMASASCSTFPH